MQEIFKDHWGWVEHPFEEEYERWMHWIDTDPDYDPSLWFVAVEGDRIAGMSLCAPKITEDPDMAWVNILGVRRPWRRRGLARALIARSLAVLKAQGMTEASLGVDAQNPNGALQLYKSMGFDPVKEDTAFRKPL